MSKFYDISSKLNVEKPLLKLSDGMIYTVNTEKNTVLKLAELQKTADENTDKKIMELLLGKEKAKEIMQYLEQLPNYQTNFTSVMIALLASVSNEDFEVVEERFRKATKEQQ